MEDWKFRDFVHGVEALSELQPRFWKHPEMDAVFFCKTALAAQYLVLDSGSDRKKEFYRTFESQNSPRFADMAKKLLSHNTLKQSFLQKIGEEYVLDFEGTIISPTLVGIYTLGN